MEIVQKILTLSSEAENAGIICQGGLNPNIEILNKFKILLRSRHPWGGAPFSNFPMFKTVTGSLLTSYSRFGYWNFEHSNLPFDLAQGGELVEPLRASCLRFRI